MSGHYYFVEKLKIMEKQLCKLYCSYGKVSHALNNNLIKICYSNFQRCEQYEASFYRRNSNNGDRLDSN